MAITKLQHKSMGSRVRTDNPCKKIPLQGVYHRLRLWLQHQYSHGYEPRPATIATRCELELASEIGVQRTLQTKNPQHSRSMSSTQQSTVSR